TIFGRRDFPCCPGAKLRFSISHLSVRHRCPFRNSLTPSRRHSRQTASRYLAKLTSSETRTSNFVLNSSALWRAAPIMRNVRHVFDIPHLQPGGGQRANG